MGLSRQEHWTGLPFPSPGDLPNPGIEPGSPALQADSSTPEPLNLPRSFIFIYFFRLHWVFFAAGAFSSCGEQGNSVGAVWRLHCRGFSCFRSWASQHVSFSRLSSCGTQAWLLHSMGDLPGSGIKPMSPDLPGSGI